MEGETMGLMTALQTATYSKGLRVLGVGGVGWGG